MIVSVHIPRTAGTTFRELLVERMQNRVVHHYYHLLDCVMQPLDKLPDWTEIIHGHFPANRFRSDFPHAALVTWVREPADRVISEYHFLRDHPDEGNVLSQLIQNGGSVVDFAEHPGSRNRLCWYFDGVPLERWAFIGITEMFDLELDRLERATGLCLRKYHRTNAGRRRVEEATTPAERAHIIRINFADQRLYDACLRRATF